MTYGVAWLGGAALLGVGFAACSNHVTIGPESTGSAHGSTGPTTSSTTVVASSSGTVGPGGTSSGAGGASNSGSTSSSSGAPGPAMVVTAETDIGQYQSITQTSGAVVSGPFFVSDVAGAVNGGALYTVTGSDCTVSQQAMVVFLPQGPFQSHGMRLPVLAGQTLCVTNSGGSLTVLGFRPY
jgi:hypothetical protein